MSALDHETVRETLLDRTGQSPLPGDVEAHLRECASCRDLAASLLVIDAQLAELGSAPPVSEDLIHRTLARIAEPDAAPAPTPGVLALLGGIVAALASGLVALGRLLIAPFTNPRARKITFIAIGATVPVLALAFTVAVPMASEDRIDDATVRSPEPEPGWFEDGEGERNPPAEALVEAEDGQRSTAGPALATPRPTEDEAMMAEEPAAARPEDDAENGLDADGLFDQGIDQSGRWYRDEDGRDGREMEQTAAEILQRGDRAAFQTKVARGGFRAAGEDLPQAHRGPAGAPEAPENRPRELERQLDQGRHSVVLLEERPPDGSRGVDWLASRESTEGLAFVDASGHWASTYVPGDPATRLVRARLADHPAALALATRAEPGPLGIDAPSTAALALDVRADRTAIQSGSRVLMQVGIRGATASAGRRPTLRVQVVVDARRPLAPAELDRLRGILGALSRSRAGSDRIGVIVAGPQGGELLPLGNLRFGELTVALRRLSAAPTAAGAAPSVSLPDAVRSAIESVGRLEDASSPLGSSLVLVLTPALTDADARTVEPAVHAGTLAGVTTTAIGLDAAAELAALERLALAGQGRRLVAGASDPDALVRDEIEAASRVVARAVRLRIRLAPGVRLVGVIDSRRLDAAETQQVRQAEQAIDRELTRRLGILSDRDQAEDGIQMVIPAFYADDEHAVLLDLVAAGPGPVADVSLRFKDLTRLENGTASARLTLARGTTRRGPAERRVLARLLAHQVAAALRDAARAIERGDVAAARARIAAARALVEGARTELPTDPTLARDVALFAGYESALVPGTAPGPWADSLRYASRRRLHGDPIAMDAR